MIIAAIFAGGVGSRMHSKDLPKQFLTLHGKPIIIHTIEIFDMHPEVDVITVACKEEWIPYLDELVKKYNIKKVIKIVPGGKSGQESIYNVLCAAEEAAGDEDSIVMIHDGVRPLINSKTISDNIASVKKYGSAITCVNVIETVLITDDQNAISEVPERSKSRLARAPQSFWLKDILQAHRNAIYENKMEFIDSCSMMQHYKKKLHLIEGPRENIKITTPEDFYVMRAMLDAKENDQIYGIEE